MPKDTFRFKEFVVRQENATLKVCTDSCLFGAWAASFRKNPARVLDIGSGTGLLSLMFAQHNESSIIEAVEADELSAALTIENFHASPWKDRLEGFHIKLQEHSMITRQKYNCIIVNPPFFENQLQSVSAARNLAKHQAGLTKEELISGITSLLSANGHAFVLLPPAEATVFAGLVSAKGLHLQECVKVYNRKETPVFRHMMLFTTAVCELKESSFIIYKSDKDYTPEFSALLSPYYLYL